MGWNGQHRQEPIYRHQRWELYEHWIPRSSVGLDGPSYPGPSMPSPDFQMCCPMPSVASEKQQAWTYEIVTAGQCSLNYVLLLAPGFLKNIYIYLFQSGRELRRWPKERIQLVLHSSGERENSDLFWPLFWSTPVFGTSQLTLENWKQTSFPILPPVWLPERRKAACISKWLYRSKSKVIERWMWPQKTVFLTLQFYSLLGHWPVKDTPE